MRIERVRIMLHTLNKAWVNILARHDKKQYLFVAYDDREKEKIFNMLLDIEETNPITSEITIADLFNVKYDISFCKYYNEEFPMYDDILVSHDIHDCMLLDFLGRHCKRKCC